MTAAQYILPAAMKCLTSLFLFLLLSVAAQAQIGYQVTLLNTATGEPRANETVNMTVVITNSAGTTICSETKSATTNDFGILSVAVGNADTFANADWSKLPFFISATVDNVMIGKSQLLSVPVAEHAKHTGELSREFLNGKRLKPWGGPSNYTLSFTKDKYTRTWGDDNPNTGDYFIIGNTIICPTTKTWTEEGAVVRVEHSYRIVYYTDGRFFSENYEWR